MGETKKCSNKGLVEGDRRRDSEIKFRLKSSSMRGVESFFRFFSFFPTFFFHIKIFTLSLSNSDVNREKSRALVGETQAETSLNSQAETSLEKRNDIQLYEYSEV